MELSKNIFINNNYKTFIILLIFSFLVGIVSLCWQFWLIFGIGLYIILIIYFSKEFRDLMNIHVVALSLIIFLPLPSIILILYDKIQLNNDESLRLFSSISLGLFGYAFGVLFLKGFYKRKQNIQLSKKLNILFWLAYKYRYVLAIISGVVLSCRGFTPMSVSYLESVRYRMETPGVFQYFNLLIPNIFSVLLLAMISIIGDVKRCRKLSWLSYLFIILVVLSIVAGHRIWIIALIACLMLAFQPNLKKRHILLIIILTIIMFFVMSGGVRYARSGESFTENINNFYDYFLNLPNMNFIDLVWEFSDFTAPFSTFINIIKNVPQNINFDYYAPIKDFSLLIPTVIYAERPLPYNKWYVKTFEPEIFERGGGRTFYIIGFGYLFAGPIGVLMYMFLFGILFEMLNIFFNLTGEAAGLFLYSYFFVQLFEFVRGCGFLGFIKNSIILNFFIPIFLLFLFVLILDSLNFKRYKYLR